MSKRAFRIDEEGPGKHFDIATWTFHCNILLNREPMPLRARFAKDMWAALRGEQVLVEVTSKEKLRKWLVEHFDELDLSPLPEPPVEPAPEPEPEPELEVVLEMAPKRKPVTEPVAVQLELSL